MFFQRIVINIFDVRTGKVMRDFKGSPDDFAIGGTGGVAGVSWPVFRYLCLLWIFLPVSVLSWLVKMVRMFFLLADDINVIVIFAGGVVERMINTLLELGRM